MEYQRGEEPNIPQRIAGELDDFLDQYCQTSDYEMGKWELEEMAVAYLLHLEEQNAFEEGMLLRVWEEWRGTPGNERWGNEQV